MALPRRAAPFFQEYDFDRLDPLAHAPLIIERLLAYGSRAELRWLVQRYSREAICAWIVQSGRARLPQGRYHLWCIVFDLQEEARPPGLWPH